MSTQAEVARVPEVAQLAAKEANTDVTPDELLDKSTVTASSGSDTLSFTVNDADPERATLLANAYAAGYVAYRSQLDTEALRRARAELDSQIGRLQATGGQADATQGAVSDLLSRSESLRTKEVLQGSNSTLGKPAEGAEKIQPKPAQSTFLGAVIGLILGIAIVFVRDALNTRVRSAEEIQTRLGIPLLGRVPPPPKQFANDDALAVLEEPHSPDSEPFRMLATSIELVNLDRGAKSIMVTSAVAREGKSTTASSLAVTYARRGAHVVLVEADVRRPALKQLFQLDDRPGLSDVVLGRSTLTQALAEIEVPTDEQFTSGNGAQAKTSRGKLEVLISGPAPPSPPEFLKSRAVANVIKALNKRADLVLIDTPPVLHLADVTTMMTTSEIDAVVTAVRLGVARRHATAELKRVLSNAPVVQLGFFMTGAPTPGEHGYRYGYEYGYTTPSGGPSRAASAARRALAREGKG